jgi:sugar phosphate isomerase/epimerase
LCKKAINLCGTLGTPYYSVHAGYRGNISPESLGGKIKYARVVSYERAYQAFVDSLRTLVAYAENRNVSILIEPNVLPAFNLRNGRNEIALICEDWEVINLVRDVNAPGIGILLDTGHLNITAHTLGFDRETFLDRVAPYVKAVHLHDNDSKEDSHEPVEQGSWVLNVIRRPEFKHLPVVVEATFATVKDLRRHVDWLKEQLERH